MARLALLCLLLLLVAADAALGQAGSGSSGFGGGGGGGGGGFSGGGSGSGSGSGGGSPVVVAIFFAIFGLIWLLVLNHARRYRKKVKQRDQRVRTASAEAAEDDAWFAAEHVDQAAADLFLKAQVAWDRRDRDRLRELVGEDLFVEWDRRLADFEQKGWHNRVQVLDGPTIQYVGIGNRDDDAQDQVVVRVQAQLRSYVTDRTGAVILMKKGESDETMQLCEYWTLARRGDRWIVASIEARAEGDHHLDAEIVTGPWADDQRMRDESLTELAVEDKVPEGFTTADLADLDFEGGARAQALDLSVADARFAPDVLEAAARRATEAWATAVDGSDAELEKVATADAVKELLYQGDASERTRLVVRGPRVKRIAIESVDVSTQPATMAIAVEVFGRRYVEDRDTAALVNGSRDRAATFTERWTLALDGSDEAPWRLVRTGARNAA